MASWTLFLRSSEGFFLASGHSEITDSHSVSPLDEEMRVLENKFVLFEGQES